MPTTTLRLGSRRSIAMPLAGVMLAVAAGSTLAATPSSVPLGAIDHPTGPSDIVLSMETGGGFVPFGYFVTQAPTFILFGDNTAIFRPSEDATGADLPAFVQATLSADQVDALLTYALTVGRLADAGPSYADSMVADAPSTVFTVNAAGYDKVVSVYALGIGDPAGPDASMYAALEDLATLLSTFEQQVEKGQVQSAELYQPALYRAVLTESDPSLPDIIDWPFDDLSLDDFQPLPESPALRLGGLTPEQLAAVTTVPSGGSYGLPIRSPDGNQVFYLQWRPLLPGDEVQPAVMGGKGF
jgi:hypothetical protein